MGEVHGVVVVDKPRGPTSHDVVARARRALGTRAIGHAGTLDPMATGVLVLAAGEATKLVPWLTAHDKVYLTTIRLGVGTDTLDADGRETERAPFAGTAAQVEEALAGERARTRQIPPAFSAIKQGGRPVHERARRGEAVELEEREVAVRAIDVVALEGADLSLRVHVGKGYYVRSLARDLAARLGTVGHLIALRRVASGPFAIDEATPFDALDRAAERAIPLAEAAARALPRVVLDDDSAARARTGRVVALDAAVGDGPCAWVDAAGVLVAVGQRDETGAGRVLRGFAPITSK